MTTSAHFSPTLSMNTTPRVRTCDGQAFRTFKDLADQLLVTAHATAGACFASWERTTFAQRAAAAATAAALRQARPVTIWTVADQSFASIPHSGYDRLRSFLSPLGFVHKKTAPAASKTPAS